MGYFCGNFGYIFNCRVFRIFQLDRTASTDYFKNFKEESLAIIFNRV